MEFHIDLASQAVNLEKVEQALRAIDPAALVDLDQDGRTLRIAAGLAAPELQGLLQATGLSLATGQVMQQPSVCCGGCGG
ncbi:MAG: hypothetical protein EOP91_00310 [Lysobacteraceae bacterium]|nr:MAG: hypothetical protein EOP91_00310 [Xanthomonadaceae bacterium]